MVTTRMHVDGYYFILKAFVKAYVSFIEMHLIRVSTNDIYIVLVQILLYHHTTYLQ